MFSGCKFTIISELVKRIKLRSLPEFQSNPRLGKRMRRLSYQAVPQVSVDRTLGSESLYFETIGEK
jgi:hypothetical protein